MSKHQNEFVTLQPAQIDELVAGVLESPEMSRLNELAQLKDIHTAEVDAGMRLKAQAGKLRVELATAQAGHQATQAMHDDLAARVRDSENDAVRKALEHRDIAVWRDEYGTRLEAVLLVGARTMLLTNNKYKGWLDSMIQLQDQLDRFPQLEKELQAKVDGVSKDASAQLLKAGKVLAEIRELEKSL